MTQHVGTAFIGRCHDVKSVKERTLFECAASAGSSSFHVKIIILFQPK